MMRKLLFLPLLFSLLVLSCGGPRQYPSSLLTADSLCDTDPQKALVWLDSISPQMLQAAEPDRMYFRLLRIKAADKAYITHTSDSLIRPLVEYYEQGGDPALLPTAYYYAGRTYMDLGDAPQAMEYYQKALHDKHIDNRLQAIIHHQLARLYWNQHITEKATVHYRLSFQQHNALGDSLNSFFDLLALAGVYEDRAKPDSSVCLYQAAYRIADKMNDELLKTDVSTQLVRFYCTQELLDSAQLYIGQLLSFPDSDDISASYSVAALYYTKKGNTDSAIYYNRKKYSLHNIYSKEEASRDLIKNYSDALQTDSARKYLGLYLQYLDSTRQRQAAEEVARVEMLYNQHSNEEFIHQLQLESTRKSYTIVIVLVSLISVSIIFLFIRRNYLEKMEKMRRRKELLDILVKKKELESNEFREKQEVEKKRLEENLKSLTAKNIQISNDLQEQKRKVEYLSLVSGNAELNRQKTEEFVVKSGIVDIIRMRVSNNEMLTRSEWDTLKDFIQSICPMFFITLSGIVKMNDLELKISMLIKTNVKLADISILVATSKQNVSAIRRRLYEKTFNVDKASPSDWDQFLYAI